MRSAEERLLASAAFGAMPDDCVLWTRCLTRDGYGYLGDRAALTSRVHRVAYETWVGPIPPGYHVDHVCHGWDLHCPGGVRCEHRRCLNPRHLEAVTPRENMRRAVDRRRRRRALLATVAGEVTV